MCLIVFLQTSKQKIGSHNFWIPFRDGRRLIKRPGIWPELGETLKWWEKIWKAWFWNPSCGENLIVAPTGCIFSTGLISSIPNGYPHWLIIHHNWWLNNLIVDFYVLILLLKSSHMYIYIFCIRIYTHFKSDCISHVSPFTIMAGEPYILHGTFK